MQMEAQEQVFTDMSLQKNYNFSEFYNEYFSRVNHYVLYRVGNYHDADDLTSQIFYKIFEKRNYYCSDKAPLFAWVFSIARNAVTDYYRKRSHNPITTLGVEIDMIDLGSGPEAIILANETKQLLYRALTSLNDRERYIITMKFWDGSTNREIAKTIGLSESNIGVTLFRAKRRLRYILEEWKEDAVDIEEINM